MAENSESSDENKNVFEDFKKMIREANLSDEMGN
jgi:hypothetical protein